MKPPTFNVSEINLKDKTFLDDFVNEINEVGVIIIEGINYSPLRRLYSHADEFFCSSEKSKCAQLIKYPFSEIEFFHYGKSLANNVQQLFPEFSQSMLEVRTYFDNIVSELKKSINEVFHEKIEDLSEDSRTHLVLASYGPFANIPMHADSTCRLLPKATNEGLMYKSRNGEINSVNINENQCIFIPGKSLEATEHEVKNGKNQRYSIVFSF